jgi:serine/threonine protein kinase
MFSYIVINYCVFRYYLSNQLSAKSDVFSFGVVLLEIITGRPPIVAGIEEGNLVQWVHHKLSGGDIESIVDPKIQYKYKINSVWKVTELACKCTEHTSSKRPTMSTVVNVLKESLDLEASMEEIHIERTENLPTDISQNFGIKGFAAADISQNSNIEMAYVGGRPMMGPSVR